MSFSASCSRASTAICTSEPVATRMTSGRRRRCRAGRSRPGRRRRRVGVAVGAARERRDVLAGQAERRRAAGVLEDRLPGGDGLVGVRGADDDEAGDRAQRGEVLDRLVGRAVLAEADGVVGPDVGHGQLHDRRQPDRRAHVVGEDEERAAVHAGAAVQGDAVHHRAHGVLADAEVQHAAVRVAGELLGGVLGGHERRLALGRRVVGLGQVGRAAPQLGQHRARSR